jgi:hypothetical protein
MEDIGNEDKLPMRHRFSARGSIPKCPVITPNDPENPERFRVSFARSSFARSTVTSNTVAAI